jgi:hypothetical protein
MKKAGFLILSSFGTNLSQLEIQSGINFKEAIREADRLLDICM